MITYTTIQGDAWDGIAYKLYSDEGQMKALIEANLDYADILIFPSGVELSCPDLEYLMEGDVPFWREDDADDIEDDDEEDEDDG